MKVYYEHVPLEPPSYSQEPGEFFPRLVGVRIFMVGNTPNVDPIYLPVVRIRRWGGQLQVEINWDRPLVFICFQRRKPFVYVHIFDEAPAEPW